MANCTWPGNDALMLAYHNNEWGKPLHNDHQLFEYIVLDSFQAGLSWKTILHKRENFRKSFDNFEAEKIALYDEEKIQLLMHDIASVYGPSLGASTNTFGNLPEGKR